MTSEDQLKWIERNIGIENYFLIKNYLETNLYARGILLKINFHSIEDIENERSRYKFKGDDILRVKQFLQLDIIAKMMMLIEDLGIFCVAFLKPLKNLKNIVLERGSTQAVNNFFDNIENMSLSEIFNIMGYPEIDKLPLSKEDKMFVKEMLLENAKEIKRGLFEIQEFRQQHQKIYNKYKHSFTIATLAKTINVSVEFLEGYDSVFMVISDRENPLQNVLPIPYGSKVLKGYEIIIGGTQTLLRDILDNHRMKIEHRLDNYLPPEVYAIGKTDEEIKRYGKIVKSIHPKPKEKSIIDVKVKDVIEKKNLQWYIKLDKFLAEAKKRQERVIHLEE